METLAAHPHPEDGFAGMEIRGDTLADRENAGAALLDACKEVINSEPVQIGSYRGFAMSVTFDAFSKEYTLLLKGQMTHRATLGTDPRGNLTRIDNALAQMPQRLKSVQNQLDNLSPSPPLKISDRNKKTNGWRSQVDFQPFSMHRERCTMCLKIQKLFWQGRQF